MIELLNRLAKTNPDAARDMVEKERDTLAFPDLCTALMAATKPDIKCGCGNSLSMTFNEKTLAWGTHQRCWTCREKEIKEMREKAFERAMKRKEDRVPRILKYKCKIPPLFIDASREDIKPSFWKTAERALNGESMVLIGNAGVGKTHLCVAIIREYILRIKPVFEDDISTNFKKIHLPRFAIVTDLLRKARMAIVSDEISEEDFVRTYTDVPFLVLDDLGAEKTTAFTIQTLYSIINTRYNHKRTTIITTNLMPSKIEENFNGISDMAGTRIVSRLQGLGIYEMKGSDMRIKK
jgi:DNA replication protein DnaC